MHPIPLGGLTRLAYAKALQVVLKAQIKHGMILKVERFQDCSGKNTYYRYDERQHLVAVTDALNQTTTLERKPNGEVLRIQHPDGSAESFTYNALGQVLTHTGNKNPASECTERACSRKQFHSQHWF
ncbi:hypothetical protein PS850_00961 [Pseudomonas fluorescens]|nr:hypothetical protein PS850_00961 [Pseudomonas fluorescens]